MNLSKDPAETLPALYMIFTLVGAIRRGVKRENIWREFRRQKIVLRPRLPFWLSICKSAGLLDERDGRVRITSHARAWLNKRPEEQAVLLIEAWQRSPRNSCDRKFRKRLLWKLQHEKPLTAKDQGALTGLSALGFEANGKLTPWGRYFLKGEGYLPTPKPDIACEIKEDQFIAPLDQHTDLLWELEEFLRPIAPGRYSLKKRSLQFFGGDPHKLIALIERGLKHEIPKTTRALILGQPSIKLTQGWVIEFSSPQELKELRRQPNLRNLIERYLSPRHILISAHSTANLTKMLERRGVHMATDEEQQHTSRKKRSHFVKQSPPHPIGRNVPKLDLLEKYLQLQQALDIFYRAPGFPAETRRITPLSIEQRGENTYVIAHCHTRRAQRTFRLDRMEIPGTY